MTILTINTTNAQALRIAAAYGKQLNTTTPATYDEEGVELTPETPRDATAAEIKLAVINSIRQVVYTQERRIALDAVTVADINPT